MFYTRAKTVICRDRDNLNISTFVLKYYCDFFPSISFMSLKDLIECTKKYYLLKKKKKPPFHVKNNVEIISYLKGTYLVINKV